MCVSTSPLKSQDASNKASKSDSGAEVEGTECEEYVTLATLKQILSMQESTLKSIFESFIMSVNHRVDDLVKTVAEVKSSLEYTQRAVDDIGQMATKLKDGEEEIGTLQTDLRTQDLKLEYLENQSRRNNIRVLGIPESPNETWEVAEAKVKHAIQEQLGIDARTGLNGEIAIAAARTPNKENRARLCVSFAAGNKEKQSLRKLGKGSQVVFSFPKTWPSLHYKGELHK